MRLIDADACPKLFDAEFKKTKRLILAGEKHLDNLAEGFMEASNVIRSMPTIAPPPNDPLTLEELREMGGEPYWHVGLQDDSPPPHWSILDPFFAKHIEDYGYGVRWFAYRRKPEEGTYDN